MSGPPGRLPQQFPLQVKEIVLGWLQDFFENHPQFPYVRGNERDTGLKLHDKHAFNLQSVGDRPAVVVDRKQMRWMRTSIGQRAGAFGLTANRVHMDLVSCGVVLHCLSKEGLVAEELAHAVLFSLEAFKNELRKRGLWEVQTDSLGEESILVGQEGTSLVSVPVVVQVFIESKWLRRRASTQLADKLDVQAEAGT